MSKFENINNGVVVSVDDSKDHRFGAEWKLFGSKTPAEKSEKPDKSWKNEDLKTFAEQNSIDLGKATKKEDLLAAITAGLSGENKSEEESDDDSDDSDDEQ